MIQPLAREQLSHSVDPQQFAFATTAELQDLDDIIGQDRAAQAIAFGVGIDRDGYNLYVMGPPGSGRHTLVRRAIDERAARAPRPPDWVYVNNFEDPRRPIAIDLPPGWAVQLRDDIKGLVDELRAGIPAVFEGDEYNNRVESTDAEFKERHEKAFAELGTEAANEQIALLRTPAGFSFAPVKHGSVMSPEEFARLPQADQERIEKVIEALQGKLEKIIREVMRWRKERFERIKALNQEMTLIVTGHLVEALKQRYAGQPKVVAYLDALQRDVLENVDDFRKPREGEQAPPRLARPEGSSLRRYEVNVLVGHASPDGSPVVEADHPTYNNLMGRVDHLAEFGTLLTDFNLIKAGALHRANGGYLLVDAAKLLMQPFAWEGLKRALLRKEIRIESLAEMYSLISTTSLEPAPIPLGLKIVLLGDRHLYYLLQAYDPDFDKFFRVLADFEDVFDRSDNNSLLYARLTATLARRSGLLPLDRTAVARVIEQGSRMAGDARKLTANLQRLQDLLHEADHYARESGRKATEAGDIQRAAAARLHRADRLHLGMREAIMRGMILIDTDGAKVGQINGLSVFEIGDFAFAEPTRITATTRLGEGHVIDIQREVALGGPIHSKGVMILSAYLAARFSSNRPHSLAATLVFEQTYGKVEGDSASLAELCALLSSLSDLPVRQDIGVTGSINQLGEAQPIGAVNEKIEGFFDICKERGLNGRQGVIIPAANIEHLMLRDDVVEAAASGRFHVYSVRTADEAVELLTGVPAGEPAAAGETPRATVNGRVAARLRELSNLRRGQAEPRRFPRREARRRKADAN